MWPFMLAVLDHPDIGHRQWDQVMPGPSFISGLLWASERNFTRRYEDRYQALLAFGALVEIGVACSYGNQNLDKTC